MSEHASLVWRNALVRGINKKVWAGWEVLESVG